MHLENTVVMYRVYNAETLERLIETVHTLHSRQTIYRSIFTGRTSEHISIIHKCLENEVYSIMQLIQCCI